MSTDFAQKTSTWSGWVIFAGVVLFTIGCLNVIQGLAALFKDNVCGDRVGLLVTADFRPGGGRSSSGVS